MCPADFASLRATMPATGTVCPRNRAMVAKASPMVEECHSIGLRDAAWKIRLAADVAKAIMLRLKAICCGLNFAFFRGQHCTVVEMQVITIASTALRFTAAVSRNGR